MCIRDSARPANATTYTTPVELTQILHDVIHKLERLPEVLITQDLPDSISVMGNETDLRRVINNLFENARRYGRTPTSGLCEIDVSATVQHNMATIDIADHGTGVPEEEKTYLLQPFTRLDSARGQANGAGLGLAIVDRIIQRHGGAFELLNRKSGGLIVRITLPTHRKS